MSNNELQLTDLEQQVLEAFMMIGYRSTDKLEATEFYKTIENESRKMEFRETRIRRI